MVEFWLGTFPIPGRVTALAEMAEGDGWDGLALTDSQNLGGDTFAGLALAARATRLFERSVEHGVSRIRTHTDVDPVVEMRSMEGILAAKQRMEERLDVDVDDRLRVE